MNIGSALTTATTGLLRNARSVQESAERIVQQPVGQMPKAPRTQRIQATQTPDLTTEIINMKQAEIGYTANATVIRTADEMSASLLDVLA